MLVLRTRLLDVADLLVHVAFHAAAERGIELRQIAKLQEIAERRLAIADFREAAMIATNSSASARSGCT